MREAPKLMALGQLLNPQQHTAPHSIGPILDGGSSWDHHVTTPRNSQLLTRAASPQAQEDLSNNTLCLPRTKYFQPSNGTAMVYTYFFVLINSYYYFYCFLSHPPQSEN